MINISSLSIGYKKGAKKTEIRSNINLTGKQGELIALIGSNGIGKSTLLRTIARLQDELSGTISIKGKNIHLYQRQEFARTLSFVSTEVIPTHQLTVFDLVALGRLPHTKWLGRLSARDVTLVNDALQKTGMTAFSRKRIDEISDGERQRVMIARTLAQNTPVILLDEPTAFLDMANKYEIVNLLNRLTKQFGKTIVFSTHDLNIAIKKADNIWLMLHHEITPAAPEDHVIANRFSQLFHNSPITFDYQTGDFVFMFHKKRKIKLIDRSDTEINRLWTKRALERIGFDTENCEKCQQCVTIEKQNVHVHWRFSDRNTTRTFHSIYQLNSFLAQKMQSPH